MNYDDIAHDKQLSNIDLNTITVSGFYRLNEGITNGFTSYAYGQLLVIHGLGDTIAQIGFPYGSSDMYFRTGNSVNNSNGKWNSWVRVTHS